MGGGIVDRSARWGSRSTRRLQVSALRPVRAGVDPGGGRARGGGVSRLIGLRCAESGLGPQGGHIFLLGLFLDGEASPPWRPAVPPR
eukprot:7118720-Prymnesium_polylepis.1